MFPGHYRDFCHLRNILERDHFLDILSYIIFKQIPLIKEIALIFSCLLQRILLLVPLRVQPEEWKALTYSISLSTTSGFLGKSPNSLNHHPNPATSSCLYTWLGPIWIFSFEKILICLFIDCCFWSSLHHAGSFITACRAQLSWGVCSLIHCPLHCKAHS